ncbi:hypothetical protein CEP52_015287 [Fusarium oligoseptatum]|uniref:Amidase n=1 Tax=Fusarium oligoseptatum TaxID=2604345 RepID=A0A428SEK2_9HYPO|nr:hypothetical protein CEP52_015287 [Fusarium oligoseptatum]
MGLFDVLLSPGHMAPSTPHDTFGIPYYTMPWNLTEAPAAIIPYLAADETVDESDPSVKNYTPSLFNGSPAHIQVIGRPGLDEEVINAVTVISNVLKP